MSIALLIVWRARGNTSAAFACSSGAACEVSMPSARYVVAGTDSGKPTDWDGTKYGYSLVLTYHEGNNGNWAVWRRS